MTVAMVRDYAPAHTIHEANCPDAPPGLFAFRAQALLETHPHSRPHVCFDRTSVTMNRFVVAAPDDSGPHRYVPSTIKPPDATRALCRVCRGTHGDVAL